MSRTPDRVRVGLGYVRGVREQEVERAGRRPRARGAVSQPVGPGLARRGGCAVARAAGMVRGVRFARRRHAGRRRGRRRGRRPRAGATARPMAAGGRDPRARRPRWGAAGAPARPAGAAAAALAVAVGVDARRLRDDRPDGALTPDCAAARADACRARSRAGSSRRSSTALGSGSVVSSSPASALGRQAGWCSSCSRTSTGRST